MESTMYYIVNYEKNFIWKGAPGCRTQLGEIFLVGSRVAMKPFTPIFQYGFKDLIEAYLYKTEIARNY